MNEPKRRGRPPKAKGLADLVGLPKTTPEEFVAPVLDEAIVDVIRNKVAQAYALRIWNGQSPDLSRHERLGRIAEALKAQGLSMEGVELP